MLKNVNHYFEFSTQFIASSCCCLGQKSHLNKFLVMTANLLELKNEQLTPSSGHLLKHTLKSTRAFLFDESSKSNLLHVFILKGSFNTVTEKH